MKKSLIAACLTLFSIAATGCLEDDAAPDDSRPDVETAEGSDLVPGFEVTVVEGFRFPTDDRIKYEDGKFKAPVREGDRFGGADQADGSSAYRYGGDYAPDLDTNDSVDTRNPNDWVGGAETNDGSSIGTSEEEAASPDAQDWVGGAETNDGSGISTSGEEASPRNDGDWVGGSETNDGSSIFSAEQASDDVSNPCACTSDDCRVEWVEENLGCNVCAVFLCGEDSSVHSCNACPQ